jgi:hypothetical protein
MLRNFIKSKYVKNESNENKEVRNNLILKSLFDDYRIMSHVFTINKTTDNDKPSHSRIILYLNKNKTPVNKMECLIEANGIVFDDDWNVMCMPCYAFNNSVDYKLIDKRINNNQYNIYTTKDSTSINLYFDPIHDKWIISTSKGINMNDNVYNKYKFIDIVNECIENMCGSFNEEELNSDKFEELQEEKKNCVANFWNKLNKNYSYSFGIRHPILQPFVCDGIQEKYMYFIQNVRLDWVNDNAIKFEDRVNRAISEVDYHNLGMPYQNENVELVNLGSILKMANNAYANYINTKNSPLFGFLLRSRDFNETKASSIIYIESSLMKCIKRCAYEIPNSIKLIKNADHTKLMLLTNYINIKYRAIVLVLFPKMFDYFTKYEMVVDMLIQEIIKINDCSEPVNSINDEMVNVAKILHKKFSVHTSCTKENVATIRDLIFNPDNIPLLYHFL